MTEKDLLLLAAAGRRLHDLLAEPHTITVTEFRRHPGRCIDLVADRPAIITLRGKPVAMLVSIEMWREVEEFERLATIRGLRDE